MRKVVITQIEQKVILKVTEQEPSLSNDTIVSLAFI